MKKLILSLLFAGLLSSCSSSDDGGTTAPQTGDITGTISADRTYPLGNYTLTGIVKIANGATVTFDAGSTITCDKTISVNNALVVLNGGKLIINGTADQPVIFTEASSTPGSWGGIIMYGDAPALVAGGGTTSTSEDGNNISYGGANPTHNGGSLKYVQVRYAGAKLNDGVKENNGFTFYSVGSGTTLDHLVSYKGADDGYEFFGGTVSATNLISYGNYDDSFDWQDGWQGQANSNWYAYQTVKGNYGMEIEASQNDNAFYPKVSNITLKRAAGTVPEVGDNQVDAIQFKREGNGWYDNVVIDGYTGFTTSATPTVTYPGAVERIEDDATNMHQVNTSKIKLTNVKATNTNLLVPTGRDAIVVTPPAGSWSTSASATGANLSGGNWSKVDGVNLLQ
ncbi:MAG: hypothetical protein EOO51_14930 [Flavobacterium sp.]|nr:MAG: hypothetical protein EOO51_14930 [Flavobacterium sp.]